MFDIGGVELIVIAAVAILVVGPRELPGMLRGIGKFARQLREMTSTVQRQFNDALKEAELDDVKKTIDDVRSLNPATKIRQTIAKEMKPLTDVGDSVKSAVGQVSTMAKPDTKPEESVADSGNTAPKAVESPPPGKKTAAPAKKPAAKKNAAKSASKTEPATAKASAPVKTGAATATSRTATRKTATKSASKTAPAAARASAPVKTGAAKATAKSAPKSAAKGAAKAAPAKARTPAKTGAARATAKTAPVTTGTGNGG